MDRRKSIVMDGPVGNRRMSIDGRRMSISDGRKYSIAESLAGRSGQLMSADGRHRMNIKLENTYQLNPDEPFPMHKAKKIANDVLSGQLESKEYNKDECTRLSTTLSENIKQQVKALGFPRFKIVVIVAIGQNQPNSRPSMTFTSRCIWNDKMDNFAEVKFKNRSLYAVALVYACYLE